MKRLKELRERLRSTYTQMQDSLKTAKDEKRDLNPEELTKFDKWEEEIRSLEKQIQVEENMEAIEERMAAERGERQEQSANPSGQNQEERSSKYATAYTSYIFNGLAGITQEERAILNAGEFEKRGTDPQSKVTANLGAYTVPQTWMADIYRSMAYYGPMVRIGTSTPAERLFNVMVTADGNIINWPKSDTTTQKGILIAENTARTVEDIPFSTTPITSYGITSKMVLVPHELSRDSAANIEAFVAEVLGDRLGRGMNDYLTTGTGSSQPQGVVTGSSLGKTAALVAAVTRSEIVDLIGSLDWAYHNRPTTALMFNQNTLTAIRKISVGGSNDLNPLWQPSMRDGVPSLIEGVPYVINNSMADMGAANKFMLFGDMSKFITRFVGAPLIRFSTERYFEFNQVAWVADWFFDGRVQDSAAIKHLISAAS